MMDAICVKFVTDQQLSFDPARTHCKSLGADLVKVKDKVKDDALDALKPSHLDTEYIIGVLDAGLGWAWLDQTKLKYSGFNTKVEVTYDMTVGFFYKSGDWKYADYKKPANFICEQNPHGETTKMPPKFTCDEEETLLYVHDPVTNRKRTSCLLVNKIKLPLKNWRNANNSCFNHKAHSDYTLVTIDTKAKHDAILKIDKITKARTPVFIGIESHLQSYWKLSKTKKKATYLNFVDSTITSPSMGGMLLKTGLWVAKLQSEHVDGSRAICERDSYPTPKTKCVAGMEGKRHPAVTCEIRKPPPTLALLESVDVFNSNGCTIVCSPSSCVTKKGINFCAARHIWKRHAYAILIMVNKNVERTDTLSDWRCDFIFPNKRLKGNNCRVQVYTPPKSLKCLKAVLRSSEFTVSCTANRVYPNARSSWFLSLNGSEVSTGYSVGQCKSLDKIYNQCTVNITTPVTQYGNVSFSMYVYPDVNFINNSARHAASEVYVVTMMADPPIDSPVLAALNHVTADKERLVVREGKNMTFDCRVKGDTKPHVSYISFKVGNASNNYPVFNGSVGQVHIIMTREMDQEKLFCLATTCTGQRDEKSWLVLDIKYPFEIQYFDVNSNDQKVSEVNKTDNLTIRCASRGNPKPETRLFRVGDDGLYEDSIAVTETYNNTIINMIKHEESECHMSARYVCSAKNRLGQSINKTRFVKVRCLPQACTKSAQNRQYFQYPGKSANISFCVFAYPEPENIRVSHKNGKRLDKNEYSVSEYHYNKLRTRLHGHVVIKAASAKLGSYSLVFHSSKSADTSKLNFTLVTPTKPNCPVSMNISANGSAILSWVPSPYPRVDQTFIICDIDDRGKTVIVDEVEDNGATVMSREFIFNELSELIHRYTLRVRNPEGVVDCPKLLAIVAVLDDPNSEGVLLLLTLEPCNKEEYSRPFKCPTKEFIELKVVQLCVKYAKEKLTWSEARSFCKKKTSDLLKVDNKGINGAVSENMPVGSGETYWTGLTNKCGSLRWLDDTTNPKWYNWKSSTHTITDSTESCVTIRPDGLWEHDECDAEKLFICQQPSGRRRFPVSSSLKNIYGTEQTFIASLYKVSCASLMDNAGKLYFRIKEGDKVTLVEDDDPRVFSPKDTFFYRVGRLCLQHSQRQLSLSLTKDSPEFEVSCCAEDAGGKAECVDKTIKQPIYVSRSPKLTQSTNTLDKDERIVISCTAFVGTRGQLVWTVNTPDSQIFMLVNIEGNVSVWNRSDFLQEGWELLEKRHFKHFAIYNSVQYHDLLGPKIQSSIKMWSHKSLLKTTIACKIEMPYNPEANTPDKIINADPFLLVEQSSENYWKRNNVARVVLGVWAIIFLGIGLIQFLVLPLLEDGKDETTTTTINYVTEEEYIEDVEIQEELQSNVESEAEINSNEDLEVEPNSNEDLKVESKSNEDLKVESEID